MKLSLTLSLLAHIALIALSTMSMPHCGNESRSGAQKEDKQNFGASGPQNVTIEHKPAPETTPIEVSLAASTIKLHRKKPKAPHRALKCREFYGGLGISQMMGEGAEYFVSEVVPGYPGAAIGLEIGDKIVYPNQDDITGEVGSELTLRVQKFSTKEIKEYTIIRDKICYKKNDRRNP